MTADALATLLSSVAAILLPAAGGWAWKTQSTVTQHTTILDEREKAEDEWRMDLKERLVRIEDKLNANHRRV